MALYRDEVDRFTIKQLRAQFTPKQLADLSRVRVSVGRASVVLEFVVKPSLSCFSGKKTYLLCPCGRATSVVGYASKANRFGCRRCLAWRERGRVG
jgi:hypothetical protein